MTATPQPQPSRLRSVLRRLAPFGGSAPYWERRYAAGGTSGTGSYGKSAQIKAAYVNQVVATHAVSSIVELGCGDGNQLSMLHTPRYLGLDVSPTAISLCAERFSDDPTKSFLWYDPAHFFDRAGILAADLALSQEVIFHLVEDEIYERYMKHLFALGNRYVLICSSDLDLRLGNHERHRTFTPWVARHCPEWTLIDHVPSPHPHEAGTGEGMLAQFFVYERHAPTSA